ncbi:dephospho-CoA kinase [Yoonia sp. BS5-3]|uniref:Dephospho-CoA kinase n=1 Tax=Yoonia phaeophyticola TaxID=3137369 RepID=A0ABZ2V601_9RHOB
MTYLLGLTGSIGMGKSTTAKMFQSLGVPVWDADAAVHRLYAKDGAAVPLIAKRFPEAIENGAVSRDRLKDLIKIDPNVLNQLEEIVHPLVAQDRQGFITSHSDPLLVFDIPLLFETGAEAWLSSVLVVTAPSDVQRARVLARPGMTETAFNDILARQMPDATKRARADHVIETLNIHDTKAAVKDLIAKLSGPAYA